MPKITNYTYYNNTEWGTKT